MSEVHVLPGFSLTNRWLLYASFMLAPAQFVSGIGNRFPSNIGFLIYNSYTQIQWYRAIQAKHIHALCLLPVHFNAINSIAYFGGLSSGLYSTALLNYTGTAGVLLLNTIAAWQSWATIQPEGFGTFEFYFFGWRTLDPFWHKFFLMWQIADSIGVALSLIFFGVIAFKVVREGDKNNEAGWLKYPAIIIGAAITLILFWPVILWTELIILRNNIKSATDMTAVGIFVAQVGLMLIPNFSRSS